METKGKEIDMPKGKGTYGTTRGRPPKKRTVRRPKKRKGY